MTSNHMVQHSMSEAQFLQHAQQTLDAVEQALEGVFAAGGWEVDLERQGPILTLEWPDGAQVVINSHASAQEIWVAARTGGFHCRYQAGQWVDTRGGRELFALLGQILSAQMGVPVIVPAP